MDLTPSTQSMSASREPYRKTGLVQGAYRVLLTGIAASLIAVGLVLYGGAVWPGLLLLAAGAASLATPQLRRPLFSKPLFALFRRVMPELSRTEREALHAGTVAPCGHSGLGCGALFRAPSVAETARHRPVHMQQVEDDPRTAGPQGVSQEARRIGLVDHALPARQLHRAARAVVLDPPAPHRPTAFQRLANHPWVLPVLGWMMKRQVAKRARPEDYPAPYALIDLWRRHGGDPKAMLREEGKSVARLIRGKTSGNLVRTFFLQERLKSQAREDPQIRRVHVIGAGRMGGDIAAWCAMQGLEVTLQDRSASQMGPAVERAHTLFRRKLREPHKVTAALDRLLPDPKGFGIAKADLIIEAVFEDAQVKHKLFKTLEPRMAEGALLATNTSSIPLESLSEVLNRPERLVGLHFFNPVAKMPLVEVVHGAGTDPAVLARASVFVRRIDRLPLPVKSAPGFLVNRILMPYLMEAVLLAEEGVPVSAIDKAATNFGMPMGPPLLADTVGLDVCLAVAQVLAPYTHVAVPARLQQWVAAGRLGRKTGRGFYRYEKGKATVPRERGQPEPELREITDRLLFSMLRECLDCLQEGAVEDTDLLDAGMLFGTGFPPFRGGPMHYLSQEDPSVLQRRLEALTEPMANALPRSGGTRHSWDRLTHRRAKAPSARRARPARTIRVIFSHTEMPV